jgi:hypothetical protein
MNWDSSPEEQYERDAKADKEHLAKCELLRRAGEILVNRWNQLQDAQRSFRMATTSFRSAMLGQPGGWPNEDNAPSAPFAFEDYVIDVDQDSEVVVRKCRVLAPSDASIVDRE